LLKIIKGLKNGLITAPDVLWKVIYAAIFPPEKFKPYNVIEINHNYTRKGHAVL